MDRDDISSLTFEQSLRELARDLRSQRRLNIDDYYQLLEWAAAYTFVPEGSTASEGSVGFEIDGVHYLLLFMTADVANDVASRCRNAIVEHTEARQVLRHVPDGWGLIVDWGTDAELRIAPDEVTELNERFRIWPVTQEATAEWLASVNSELAELGVPVSARAETAMAKWAALNGFRILPGSRRARRIEHYFSVCSDGVKSVWRTQCDQRWRREYLVDAYLHHLDDSDLQTRLATVMTNLLFIDRGSLPHELTEIEWTQLFHDVRFEHDRRGTSFLAAIRSTDMLQAWPSLHRGEEVFATYSGPPGQLFRYSKRKYLEPLLKRGQLTLFAAERYNDPSLLQAQHDDERARTLILDGAKIRLAHTDRHGVSRPITATGSVKYSMSTPTNYYVWFTATTFDPRLFDDFDADACLIIHDARRFTDHVLAAVAKALPRWVPAEQLVRYFDPLRTQGKVLASFHKDFKFAYQREFRFVWDPPAPEIKGELPPLNLDLGRLDDICSLLIL